jgi:pimeloyl-ACP methyl ester carboxylesterase
VVTYVERGKREGQAVLHFHGWPSSSLEQFAPEPLLQQLNLHWFSLDRPGYGGTHRPPGRRLADWAQQVEAFADSQNIERFDVVGFSGGGPYAMAVAHQLPARVRSLTLICSLSPFRPPEGVDHPPPWAGMGEFLLRKALPVARVGFRMADRCRRWQPVIFERLQLQGFNPLDRPLCGSPEMQRKFIDIHERANRQGSDHLVEDLQLYDAPWGFAPAAIRVPTRIFVGAEDTQVPAACSHWLARQIPGATLQVYPGEAHYVAYKHPEEILSGLAAR